MQSQVMDSRDKVKGEQAIAGQKGTVKIAGDVVAVIAGLAALEVDGVYALAGGVKSAEVERLSRSKLSRSVRVTLAPSQVKVDMAVIMDYGYNIPTTSSRVQLRVKNAIESMTGLKVLGVNVRIAEINMPAAV